MPQTKCAKLCTVYMVEKNYNTLLPCMYAYTLYVLYITCKYTMTINFTNPYLIVILMNLLSIIIHVYFSLFLRSIINTCNGGQVVNDSGSLGQFVTWVYVLTMNGLTSCIDMLLVILSDSDIQFFERTATNKHVDSTKKVLPRMLPILPIIISFLGMCSTTTLFH